MSKKQKTIREIIVTNEIYKNALDIESVVNPDEELVIRSESNKSLGFKLRDKKSIRESAEDIYSIFFPKDDDKERKERFITKFNEAVSGSGKEIEKINALHSSSLCALLFFFDVNKENSIIIDGKEYIDVKFEYQNKVFKSPSNMDVVLIRADDEILFLECKFSEYINNSCERIPIAYFENDLSKELYGSVDSLKAHECSCEEAHCIKFKRAYSHGIKQIISHIVGMNNFINGVNYSKEKRKLPNNGNVKFREVLFKLEGFNNAYKEYEELSNGALSKFREHVSKRIELKNLLNYQKIFKDNKDKKYFEDKTKIISFYKLNR